MVPREGKERAIHGVIRRYRVDPASTEEIVRRAQEGFVPLISGAAGFVSYAIADLGGGDIATVSIFEDRAGADESVRTAASWIKEHLAALLPNPPQVTSGEVSIRQVVANARPAYGVMRQYRTDPGSVAEATRRVREQFVPIISNVPGFASYVVIDAGNGLVISLSAFRDQAAADESTRMAATWVKDNLASLMPNPPEVSTATIKVRKVKGEADA
jgi:hypothetical protein